MSLGKTAFSSITNARSEEPAAANELKLSLMAQSHWEMPEQKPERRCQGHARVLGGFVLHTYVFLPESVGPDMYHPFTYLLLHKDMKQCYGVRRGLGKGTVGDFFPRLRLQVVLA